MKKNITINLFGTLYNIDEDACELLERYLDNIKRYFKNREGGEDISDDIEHRVAELLWERKQAGSTPATSRAPMDSRATGEPTELPSKCAVALPDAASIATCRTPCWAVYARVSTTTSAGPIR